MTEQAAKPKTIRINKNDNVLVAIVAIHPGDKEWIEGKEVTFSEEIAIGHKIACGPIHAGEKIVKCGVPIGSAKQEIGRGAHIHLHNLKSDYIPTYTLDKDMSYVS